MSFDIEKELEIRGPGSGKEHPLPFEEASRYCRKLALQHYENFPVVTWALPKKLRPHFYHIYAFCRWSDDLGDEIEGSERSLELLDWWENELESCYRGESDHPVMIALSRTVQEFKIPVEPFTDLISAFRQDQKVTRYDTFEELLDYCRRSANPVGRLILYLCGEFNEENAELSDSICTGLQLANFWQDVSRDFKMGRVYLPKEDLEKFHCTEEHLISHSTSPELKNLLQYEVEVAKDFFERGKPLISRLKGRIQIDIDLFLLGGMKILEKIEGIDFRVIEKRPEITKTEFFGLGIKALFRYFKR